MNLIYDLHNDYFTSIKHSASKLNYFKKSSKYISRVATVVWTTEFDAKKAMKELHDATELTTKNGNLFLAIEDLGFASKQNLFEIVNYHPTYCGLTWNYNNNFAGGARDNGDLTSFGKDTINLFETNDIIVDTAHLNEKSFMSFASVTTKPMLCSHTASYTICQNPRNLKDYQIKIIAESGGIVGICLVSSFLTGKKFSTIDDFVYHIDYLVNKFGINHFAIGTDFYGTKNLPKGVSNYKDLQNRLTQKLNKLGYKDEDICKLFYKNAEKFFN